MHKLTAVLMSIALSVAGLAVAGTDPATADEPPQVLPTPQSRVNEGAEVALNGPVTVVAPPDADVPAKKLLLELIKQAGGVATLVPDPIAGSGPVVYLGLAADTPAGVRASLGVEGASSLAADGYVLATGTHESRPTLLLEGKDATGLYYSVTTLRQLVKTGKVAPVKIRDWPLMSIRGGIEGFYGIPWSHQARLDQFTFYGLHKMNTYIYTPKDDDYLRLQWRTLYPQAELDKLSELVTAARANHVEFVFALSPGNDICYSADADYDATVAKFEQLRSIGVSSFYIALDDIDPYLKCAADLAKFTSAGFRKLADGQAFYLNRVVEGFIKAHDLPPLQTVPTNYAGSAPDPYKDQFGRQVDPSVRIQWTGEGVFSDQITMASVERAATTYVTDHLYIWDNFPVNDGQPQRLFLNPLDGRAPELYQHIEGITSNPMVQPYASMIALAGYGDYTWNGPAYRPATTQASIINELAGPDVAVRKALRVFVDLNQDWTPYRPSSQQAPELGADITAFRTALAAGNTAGMQPLADRLTEIKNLRTTLKPMAMQGFYADVEPWLDAAADWADAMLGAVEALKALQAKDGVVATDAILRAVDARASALGTARIAGLADGGGINPTRYVPKVGDGRFNSFVDDAIAAYNTWLNAEPVPAGAQLTGTASRSDDLGQWQNYAVARMTDGDDTSYWWSNAAPKVGSWVQLDLGQTQAVGRVTVLQSDNDTTLGDMIYSADLEYSTDGTQWQRAGHFESQPVISHDFAAPVQARYLRISATAANPGGNWVKIRAFKAFGAATSLATSVKTADGHSLGAAFDVDVRTSLRSASAVTGTDHLQRTLSAPRTGGSVAVVGRTAGVVQLRTASPVARAAGDWVDVMTLDGRVSFHETNVPDSVGAYDAVRILFAAAPSVEVVELIARTGPRVSEEQQPSASPTPSQSASAEPSQSVEPTPTESASAQPTTTSQPSQTMTPSYTSSPTSTTTQRPSTVRPVKPGLPKTGE